jgi:hypothetical protein
VNERLVVIPFSAGEVGVTLGDGAHYMYVPCDISVVYVSVAPNADDAGLDIDIVDDGTDVISTIACADADVPGTWASTHFGGSNDTVHIAAGSKVSINVNDAAANTAIAGEIWALVNE